jgi:hypothetical protein
MQLLHDTFSFLFTFNPLLLPINYFSLRDNIDWFAFENRSYVVFPKSKLYICTKIKNSKGSTKNMYRKVDIQTYVYRIIGLEDTQSYSSKKATSSSKSFIITKTNWIVITKIQFITTNSNTKNTINLLILLFPTQLFIHGQWWSYCSIHVLHVSQWYALTGLYWTHLKQIAYILVSAFNILNDDDEWWLKIVPSVILESFLRFLWIID